MDGLSSQDDGSIAGQEDRTHWIWNEGFPAEVAHYEGTRTIAIGPSTSHRSWNAPRLFRHMPGWLRIERMVVPREAEARFAFIAASRRRGG